MGTMLVLAIGVAGISTAVVVGAPILQGLQDQAALAAAMGRFEELRARASRLSVEDATAAAALDAAGGRIAVQQGSQILVTTDRPDASYPNCDLRFRSWANGDRYLNFAFPAVVCPRPALTGLPLIADCDTLDVLDSQSCLAAYKLPDGVTNHAQSVTLDGTNATLDETIDANETWRFVLTDNGGAIRSEAYLFPSDRVEWERRSAAGGARIVYEGGALFARRDGGLVQSMPPFIDEGAGTSSDAFFLRVSALDVDNTATISGGGPHIVELSYEGGHPYLFQDAATRVRLDFYGDLARVWCTSLLERNKALGATPYTEQSDIGTVLGTTDGGHQCSPAPGVANADGIRGVVYDPAGAGTFLTTFSLQVIDARLVQ